MRRMLTLVVLIAAFVALTMTPAASTNAVPAPYWNNWTLTYPDWRTSPGFAPRNGFWVSGQGTTDGAGTGCISQYQVYWVKFVGTQGGLQNQATSPLGYCGQWHSPITASYARAWCVVYDYSNYNAVFLTCRA